MGLENSVQLIRTVRAKRPLVHHITNYVTVNDCANACICCGGSPVMADANEEMEEMASIASALV
ncbi:MAG: hydroxyethylthiazole kinase, partial [Candidatus Methanomethylophilaceae archaeon]|nr:hydroxyethylthiazole kinase [Candidatus Methanomethylophilaceae archaeon]